MPVDTTSRDTAVVTFRPRPSRGGAWLVAVAVGIVVLMVAPLLPVAGEIPLPILLVNVGIGLLFAIPLLVLAAWIPTMRYELDDQALTLCYGPILRYRIPLEDIQEMRRKNLKISLWSSMRFPGLALFTVPYADEGRVKMCATATADRILLIDTPRGTYGVTPADEEAFVAAVRARIGV